MTVKLLGVKQCERPNCDLCELLNELFADIKLICGDFKMGKYGELYNH